MYLQEPAATMKPQRRHRCLRKRKSYDTQVAEFMALESQNHFEYHLSTKILGKSKGWTLLSIEDTIEKYLKSKGIYKLGIQQKKEEYFSTLRKNISQVIGEDIYSSSLQSPISSPDCNNRVEGQSSFSFRLEKLSLGNLKDMLDSRQGQMRISQSSHEKVVHLSLAQSFITEPTKTISYSAIAGQTESIQF